PVEGAVLMMDRLQDLDGTVAGGIVTLFDGQVGPQLSLQVADVSRGEKQAACAGAHVEVSRRECREGESKFQGTLFSAHRGHSSYFAAGVNRKAVVGHSCHCFEE